MTDALGLQVAAKEVAAWLHSLGYPYDFTTNILPPRWLRPYIEQAWIDSFDLDDLDDRQSAGMSVAEEGGWVHRFHGQEDDAGNPIPCLLCDEDWTPDDDDDDG